MFVVFAKHVTSKMSAPVAVAAAPANNDNNVVPEQEEDEVTNHEKVHLEFQSSIASIRAQLDSFSARTFFEAGNYKSKQGLEKTDPGKADFRSLGTKIGKLGKLGDRAFKSVKPTAKRATTEKSKTSGFNRLVITSEALCNFLNCKDWGLTSEIEPNKGVMTHGAITRWFANYIALNGCRNTEKDRKATWKADAKLLELFKDQWGPENVNPQAVKYVEIQKLLKHHITTAPKTGYENRNEAQYRSKLDDEGEFGKATLTVLALKNTIDDLATTIRKQSEHLATVRSRQSSPAMIKGFEDELRISLTAFDKAGKEIRELAGKNNFPISPMFPVRPATPLDAK